MKTILYLLLVAFNLQAFAQKEISGTYKYYVPANESVEVARHTAIDRARLQALAREFGEAISQTQALTSSDIDGQYSDAFYSSGESSVQGEWLQDTKELVVSQSIENNMLVIEATVTGLARSKSHLGVDFTSRTLRNGTRSAFESTEFKSGDQIYLTFQTPQVGYLAVYLVDETKTAYCLLPYRSQSFGIQPIKANTEYLFFDAATDNAADEYELNCENDKGIIFNDLYIIFSKNDFVKAVDKQSAQNAEGLDMPRSLSFADFQKWLNKRRAADADLQVKLQTITIRR